MKRHLVAVSAAACLALLLAPGVHAADSRASGVAAVAAANPYERGPAPSTASIEALRGPYAVSETSVSSLAVTGFGGGTVYYPTSTSDGTFGAVVISPGFTALQSSIAWLGPRLASQGFVVFTIDTNTTLDQPDSRGRQLLAALDYLTQRSTVRGRVDATRLGVMGHSMGGGGTLEAAKSRPSSRPPFPSPRGTRTRPGPRSPRPRSSSAPTATRSPPSPPTPSPSTRACPPRSTRRTWNSTAPRTSLPTPRTRRSRSTASRG